jgi:hypothetical protein
MRSLSGFFATLLIRAGGGPPLTLPRCVAPASIRWSKNIAIACTASSFAVMCWRRYQQALAAELPIRFVVIAEAGKDRPGLRRRVDALPSVGLMLGGREIDRIVGYWGDPTCLQTAGACARQGRGAGGLLGRCWRERLAAAAGVGFDAVVARARAAEGRPWTGGVSCKRVVPQRWLREPRPPGPRQILPEPVGPPGRPRLPARAC